MKKELIKYRAHIINSKFFSNKEVQKKLLNFLFDKTIEGEEISEFDLAESVFGRKDFDSSNDTIVRVNIHKLRQSLSQYYLEEGKDDEIILSIPKGKYKLDYGLEEKFTKEDRSKNIIQSLLLLMALVLMLVVSTFFYMKDRKPQPENILWSDFNFDKSTTVLLGTPYFKSIIPKNSDDILFVRSHKYNSAEEAGDYFQKYFPLDSFTHKEMSFNYISPSSFYGAIPIIKDLSAIRNLDVTLLPEYNSTDISSENIIYVGSIKSMGFLESYLKKTSFSVKNSDHPMIVLNDTAEYRTNSNPSKEFVDYAICVKMKGETELPIVFISDLHGSGIRGIIHLFKTEQILNYIPYKKLPEYFELLVKVDGVDYTNYNIEILYFEEL